MSQGPPRFLRRILERAVPEEGASGSSLLGDLLEEYASQRRRSGPVRANLWYAAQSLSISGVYLLDRAWRATLGRPGRVGHGLKLDLLHTSRGLRRNPLVTLIAVVSLSLGIGLTTSVTSLVNGVWLAPLPYPDAERLVDLDDTHPEEVCFGCSVGTSYASFAEWRSELPVFQDITAMSGGSSRVEIGDRLQDVPVSAVAGNYAEFMGATTLLGRPVLPDDELPSAPPVLVLGPRLWATAFGSDSTVVGRTIRVDGVLHTVVGVLAPDPPILDRAQAWTALRRPASSLGYGERDLWAIGRLAEGVSLEEADAALAGFASARYSNDTELTPGWSARARPLRAVLAEDAGPIAMGLALLLATGIVLAVACVNLAALMLSRITERERELGIRLAIGSSRARLARVSVLESAILAVAGGVGGLGITLLVTGQFARFLLGRTPGWVDVSPDPRVLIVAVMTVIGTAVACGLLPVLRALAVAPGHGVIRSMNRRSGAGRLTRHDWFLGAQVVLGVILVGGGLAAVRSVVRVSDFDSLGHRYENLTSVEIAVPEGVYLEPEEAFSLARGLGERLATHPSVGTVVAVRPLFLGSWGASDGPSPVWVDGAPEAVSDRVVPRHSSSVGAGYFELMEIPIMAGRSIRSGDVPGREAVAVVSRSAALNMWPQHDPTQTVGERFRVELEDMSQTFTVVGVAADVVGNPSSESRRPLPMIYTALPQTHPALFDRGFSSRLTFNLDVRGDAPTERALEQLIAEVDPALALTRATTVEANLRQSIMPLILVAGLLSVLAAVALGLLMLGIYGTLSYRIARSRHEIGVRIAIGARPSALVKVVTLRVGRVLAVSMAIGAAVSVLVARTVGGGEVPLGGAEPIVLLGSGAVMLGVAALACLVPVRRALAIDPIESLRAD